VPFPQQSAILTKDISSSAPGSAKLAASVTGDAVDTMTFAVDNPGRPNGPDLRVDVGYFSYALPARFANSNNYGGPGQFGPCSIGGGGVSGVDVQCKGVADDSGTSSDDGKEADVDALLHAINGVRPYYLIDFDPLLAACYLRISPTGRADLRAERQNGCGKLSLHIDTGGTPTNAAEGSSG
jgi:hypothetical protein